jgi:hypothetical protein
LAKEKNFGASAEQLTDEVVTELKGRAENFGPGSIKRTNAEDVQAKTGLSSRQYGRSEEKSEQLQRIVDEGSIEYDPENKDHDTWVGNKVVDYKATPTIELAQVREEDFTADEREALVAIATDTDVENVPFRDMRSLAQKGAITIELTEGTTRARGGKETRFNNVLRGSEVGSGTIASATSLDQLEAGGSFIDAGTFTGEVAEAGGFDIMETQDTDLGFEGASQESGDIDSSWGLFNRQGTGRILERTLDKQGGKMYRLPMQTFNNLWGKFARATGLTLRDIGEYVDGLYTPYNNNTMTVSSKFFDVLHFYLASGELAVGADKLLEYAQADMDISKYTTESAIGKGGARAYVEELSNSDNENDQFIAEVARGIMNVTGIDQFNLSVEALKEANGYFSGVENLITLDNTESGALSLAHEVGHWAYKNLLTADQRLSYIKDFIKEYGNADGTFDVDKILEDIPTLDLTSGNVAENMNEVFAEQFAQRTLNDKNIMAGMKPKTRNTFDKLIDVFKAIWNKIRGIKHTHPVFDQYIQLALDNNRTAKEEALFRELGIYEINNAVSSPYTALSNPSLKSDATGFTDATQANAKKRESERIVADAILAESINQIEVS